MILQVKPKLLNQALIQILIGMRIGDGQFTKNDLRELIKQNKIPGMDLTDPRYQGEDRLL